MLQVTSLENIGEQMYTIEWHTFQGKYSLCGCEKSILSLAHYFEGHGIDFTVAGHGNFLHPKHLTDERFNHWLVANDIQPPNTIRVHVTNSYRPEENEWIFVPEATSEELEVMKNSRIKFVKMYRERCHTSLKVAVVVAEHYSGR